MLTIYKVTLGRLNYMPGDDEYLKEAKTMATEDKLVPADKLATLRFAFVSGR